MRLIPVLAVSTGACGRIDFDPAPVGRFSAPEKVEELSRPDTDEDDPTVTADLLELYFDSDRPGGRGRSDIWMARRSAPDQPWGQPEPVAELSSDGFDSDPEVSDDGLALYFNSNRPENSGATTVFVSTRPDRRSAWSEPVRVEELDSGGGDYGPAVTADELLLLLCRDAGGQSALFAATRPSKNDPWEQPTRIAELDSPATECDPTITSDGRAVIFGSERAGGAGDFDLYLAERPSRRDPFGPPEHLSALASPVREADGWISEDLRTVIFASAREGSRDLYIARR